MYRQLLGERFHLLPAGVQRFHRLAGHRVLSGEVQTEAPASRPARLLAWLLGTPRRSASGPIRFELRARPQQETWTRHFPTQTMRSTLSRAGTEVHEVLGLSRLRFRLHASPQALEMQLIGLRFLGLPCPRRLLPEVVARETGAGPRLHFEVSARMRGFGLVAGYRGHLDLPEDA